MIIINHEGKEVLCSITPSNIDFKRAVYDNNLDAYTVPTDFASDGFESFIAYFEDEWSIFIFSGEDYGGYDLFDIKWDFEASNDVKIFQMLTTRWFRNHAQKLDEKREKYIGMGLDF